MFETERLELHPLSAAELRLLVEDTSALEKQLKISYQAEPLEGHFLEILRGQTIICEASPDDYLWHSFWLLIRKADRIVVGSADFKKPPDENNQVEIGYGLGKAFEHNGFMTEAVQCMCDWALSQPNVANVIAETDLDNLPSQRILQRCGFHETSRTESVWWTT